MGQGNEWRGRVMEGKLGDRLDRVCGCGCGCVGVGIYMSLYCMLDGVRQGRRDI